MKKLNSIVALAALFMVLYSTSCKKWGTGGGGGGSQSCNIKGELFRPMCGLSVLDGLWIRAENGKIYQPCANDIINIAAETYREGDKISFSVRTLKTGESCKDELILCPANTIPPDYKVGLTCITKTSPLEFTADGFFRNYKKLDGCNWVFESISGQKYEVLSIPSKDTILSDERVSIRYTLSPSSASVCMVGALIDVKFMRYFDVSNACRPIISGPSPDSKQTVSILSARTEGNILWLKLGYGGCQFNDKPISLYLENTTLSADPPYMSLKLGHLPEEQLCNAYFQKEICFDMSTVIKQGTYMNLHISGYTGSPLVLHY